MLQVDVNSLLHGSRTKPLAGPPSGSQSIGLQDALAPDQVDVGRHCRRDDPAKACPGSQVKVQLWPVTIPVQSIVPFNGGIKVGHGRAERECNKHLHVRVPHAWQAYLHKRFHYQATRILAHNHRNSCQCCSCIFAGSLRYQNQHTHQYLYTQNVILLSHTVFTLLLG